MRIPLEQFLGTDEYAASSTAPIYFADLRAPREFLAEKPDSAPPTPSILCRVLYEKHLSNQTVPSYPVSFAIKSVGEITAIVWLPRTGL
jgi:hypothetical protein